MGTKEDGGTMADREDAAKQNPFWIEEEFHRDKPSTDGRLPRETAVYELLDRLGISYQRIDHDPVDTIADCEAVDRKLNTTICKNLFLCNRQTTKFYLLMIPGEKKFLTKELSKQIGSARLSFAGAEEMERYLDIRPGAVSVMGLMNDQENQVQLLVDREVFEVQTVGCHPCVNTASLKLKASDLWEKFLPAVGHVSQVVELTGEAGEE